LDDRPDRSAANREPEPLSISIGAIISTTYLP